MLSLENEQEIGIGGHFRKNEQHEIKAEELKYRIFLENKQPNLTENVTIREAFMESFEQQDEESAQN